MEPAGGVVLSACRSMMYVPGNWINMSGPFCTTVPPMVSVQNFFCTSTSFTNRCMCPMVTPAPFGGASCAQAGKTANAAAISGNKNRIFITLFLIGFSVSYLALRRNIHLTTVDCNLQPVQGVHLTIDFPQGTVYLFANYSSTKAGV